VPRITLVSLADLYANPPPPTEDLWGRGWIIHPSLVLIGAEQKAGKSLFAMQLLWNLLNPGVVSWLGQPMATVSRIAYLNEEIPQASVLDRAHLMWNGTSPEKWVENYLVPPERGLRFDSDPRAFYEICEEMSADVVCVDPLARYHLLDENLNQHMGLLLDRFSAVVKFQHRTVVMVHHFRKAGIGDTRSAFSHLRGASRLTADPDSIFALQPYVGSKKFQLGGQLRHGEWPGDLLIERDAHALYQLSGSTTDIKAKVLEAAADNPHLNVLRDRLAAVGIPDTLATIQQAVREGALVQDGAIFSPKEGA